MRASALSRRRSAAPTFLSLTSWARPTTLAGATRQVPFTTSAGLTTALNAMAPGDYIYYNGTGVLTISSASTNAFTIASKNPTGTVTIDFGTKQSIWNAGAVSGNYVKFNYTGSSAFASLYMHSNSNLVVYGGEFTSTNSGIFFYDGQTNVTFWDWVAHDCGSGGIQTAAGGFGDTTSCSLRGEVYNFAMNPALDNHADKGTGLHCCLIENTASSAKNFNSNTVAIYGHDSLQPGAVSYGSTWPEGGGGSCIEIGSANAGVTLNNNTLYAKGANLSMKPGSGTNPGSTGVQTGGNLFNLWGSIKLNGTIIGWAEGSSLTGTLVHCASGGWSTSPSPPITVNHGRSTSVNLFTGGGNAAPNNVPYPLGFNIVYNDCTQMPSTYGVAVYGTDVYGAVAPSPPTNTVAPAVTGLVLVGFSVSSTSGTWTDSGHISYTYQWQDSSDGATNWGNIASATSSSYTIPSTEALKYLRCVVTDTDANGATIANSNVVGPVAWPVPTSTADPVISGTAQVDSILVSTSGSWNDDGSPVFSYQWQNSANGVANWGNLSTGAIYLIEPARQTEFLRCVVTNTSSGGTASATSNVLGPVTAVPIVGIPLFPITPGTLPLPVDPNSPQESVPIATLSTLQSDVAGVLGLDFNAATPTTGDGPRLLGWANDAVVDLLERTHCYIAVSTMALTPNQGDYSLDASILAIDDIFLSSGGANFKVWRKSTTDLLNLRLFSTAGTAQMYALNGANMLMVYPIPIQADTFTIYYVPRPTPLANPVDDPSVPPLGGIPTEFHYGIELYMQWKAADTFDDESSSNGESYRRMYLGDPNAPIGTPQREGFIGTMKKDIRHKGGKHMPGILIGGRGRRVYIPNPGVDVGSLY